MNTIFIHSHASRLRMVIHFVSQLCLSLFLGGLSISSLALAQSGCTLTIDCASCGGGAKFECECPKNMPTNASLIGCCCPGPTGGTCSSTCGGCCTRWQNPGGSIGVSCLVRSCLGGTSCNTWSCAQNTGKSEDVIASLTPNVMKLKPVAFVQSGPAIDGAIRVNTVGSEDPLSPLVVTRATVAGKGNSIAGVSYSIANQGTKSIVASMVELRWKEQSGTESVITFRYDGYIGRAYLEPGQTIDLNTTFRQELKAPIQSVSVLVTFALNESGQAFGKHAKTIAEDLIGNYREQLRLFDRVRKSLESAAPGNELKVVEALIEEAGESKKCGDAIALLTNSIRTQGLEGVRELLQSNIQRSIQ